LDAYRPNKGSKWRAGISNPANTMALVLMARQPNAHAELKPVCTGIGAELRTLLSHVLREPIPEGMAESLRRLDQPAAKPSERHDR
jgi:hypothetical protein